MKIISKIIPLIIICAFLQGCIGIPLGSSLKSKEVIGKRIDENGNVQSFIEKQEIYNYHFYILSVEGPFEKSTSLIIHYFMNENHEYINIDHIKFERPVGSSYPHDYIDNFLPVSGTKTWIAFHIYDAKRYTHDYELVVFDCKKVLHKELIKGCIVDDCTKRSSCLSLNSHGIYPDQENKHIVFKTVNGDYKFHTDSYFLEKQQSESKEVSPCIIQSAKAITNGSGEQVSVALPKEIQKESTNSLGMKFIYIPPGTFMMGSPSDEPERNEDEIQHQVTLTKGFYMQTTEVTQGQWKSLMGSNPSKFSDCGDNCPVEQASWNDVAEFIKRLNQKERTGRYRLPTEAEWEYACRAGTDTPFAFGNTLSRNKANYGGIYTIGAGSKKKEIYNKKPIPVASFAANTWGLYDMHGNVAEWCQDWRCEDWKGGYTREPITDPLGPLSGNFRINRGGDWFGFEKHCRSACRAYNAPNDKYEYIGFRLVRDI